MAIVVVVAATSHNPSIRGPTGELGTVRQLQFAQHRAHMGLHGLDGDEQFRSHLLVRVAAREEKTIPVPSPCTLRQGGCRAWYVKAAPLP